MGIYRGLGIDLVLIWRNCVAFTRSTLRNLRTLQTPKYANPLLERLPYRTLWSPGSNMHHDVVKHNAVRAFRTITRSPCRFLKNMQLSLWSQKTTTSLKSPPIRDVAYELARNIPWWNDSLVSSQNPHQHLGQRLAQVCCYMGFSSTGCRGRTQVTHGLYVAPDTFRFGLYDVLMKVQRDNWSILDQLLAMSQRCCWLKAMIDEPQCSTVSALGTPWDSPTGW